MIHKGHFRRCNNPINGADLVVGCLIERVCSLDDEVAAVHSGKPPLKSGGG